MNTKRLQVKVDRTRWYRGRTSEDSKLYNPREQRLCCIGFLGLALGCDEYAMANIDTLAELSLNQYGTAPADMKKAAREFNRAHRNALAEAYLVNDEPEYTDKVRERKLRAIGRSMGVNFKFVGKETSCCAK